MQFLLWFFQALTFLIIADAVLSWVMPPSKFPRSLTTRITDPLYAPIRKLINPAKTGGIDLSPLIVLFALQALRSLVFGRF
jgi:YggT family protein